MYKRILPSLLALLLCLVCGAAMAQEIAWQEEFNGPALPANTTVQYNNRGTVRTTDPMIIDEMKDGALKLGLRNTPGWKDEEARLVVDARSWGPFDLIKYPFIEIRWRGTGEGFVFYYTVDSIGGSRRQGYTWPNIDRKETDAQGREWNITRFRIAPDSSVPTKATASRLIDIMLVVRAFPGQGNLIATEDAYTEFDYVRVRAFTAEEANKEQNVVNSFKDYPRGKWKGFSTFFPFGVYGIGYLGGDFDYWGGGRDGAFGLYSRYGMNFIASDDEIELGRMGGQISESGLNAFIEAMKKMVQQGKDNGMKMAGDVRRMMDTRDPYNGYQQLLPITKRLAQAFPTDDVIVGWKLADEPGASDILSYGMMLRALLEADPAKRPGLIVFNNPEAFMPYSAYSQLGYWDNYPGHNPWNVRSLAREYQKAAGDEPVWAVLQAFETRPPADSYERTSDAETRMMAYISIAEGAKGILWFNGWSGSGRDEGMVTRTGGPQGHWLYTIADLSKVFIPVGRQLLSTYPLTETDFKTIKRGDVPVRVSEVVAPQGKKMQVELVEYSLPSSLQRRADGKGIRANVLRDRNRPVSYLVVVNEDLEAARRADVTVPSQLLGKGYGVYDLNNITGKNLLKGSSFSVEPLAGGDGRIYLIADAATFKAKRGKILCDAALEQVRALTPDITVARRWGLDLSAVDKSVAWCRSGASKGDVVAATGHAPMAKMYLDEVMASNSQLNVTRFMLQEVARELDEVCRITESDSQDPRWWTGRRHPMMIPNARHLELSKRYWEVGRKYRDLYTRYLMGQKEGLSGDVFRLKMDSQAMRDAVLAMVRKDFRPEKEPVSQ